MSCVDLKYISSKECMGNSLSSINGNFAALSAAVCDLSAASSFNVVDSPTIDLDWNVSTKTLSADASYLLTLINTLSTNMQNIGNYPYLEYAWVTAPNAAGQTLTANTSAVLTLNTEVADSGNYGSLTSNQITLSAGTYLIKGLIPLNIYGSAFGTGIVFVRNVTTGQFITRFGASAGNTTESIWFLPEFQSTFSTITTLEFGIITTATSEIQNQVETYGFGAGTSTFTNLDQRTTIKLWKVG